jgi:DNA ligase D-like protein (predicted 3'-phosphoesterase)
MATSGGRFVVQEHHARTHHFDFRLEKDGVFKSWAVPKGLPDAVGVKRLAIQVQDHALEFGDFEGAIPPGENGAGEIRVWDSGTYELVEWTEDRIRVRLQGTQATGVFEVLKFYHGKEREWLIIQRSAF